MATLAIFSRPAAKKGIFPHAHPRKFALATMHEHKCVFNPSSRHAFTHYFLRFGFIKLPP